MNSLNSCPQYKYTEILTDTIYLIQNLLLEIEGK